MNKYLYILLIVILLVSGFFIFGNKPQVENIVSKDGKVSFTFSNPKKSAHYESNTPAHGSVLAAVPLNIVINFNFDLSTKSSISITDINNVEYGTGDTLVDSNKLTLRRLVSSTLPDGIYSVNYSACWPDNSCHKGYFQFAIDRSLALDYLELRDRPELEISLSDLAFKPMNIRISAGTKITWKRQFRIFYF